MTAYFQQKLGVLNRNFLAFLTAAIRKTPNADFTPSVRDYLKHVADLDNMYAKPSDPKKARTTFGKKESSDSTPNSTPKSGILKASDSSEPKTNGIASKKVTFGGEESQEEVEKKRAAKVRELLEKEQQEKEKSRPTPKTNFKPENLRASRKRSKFGGEEDDRIETVTFKSGSDKGNGLNDEAPAPVIPDFLKKAQSDGASFWQKKKPEAESEKKTAPADGPTFSWQLKKPETEAEPQKKKDKPESDGPTSSWQLKKPEGEAEAQKKADKPVSDGLSFSWQPKKLDAESQKKIESGVPTFSWQQKKADAESDKKTEAESESKKPEPALQFKKAEPAVAPLSSAPKPTPLFSFLKPQPQPEGASSSTTEQGEAAAEEADEPPKVEAVVNEEPGTIFMTKCGVHIFKSGAYTKLGVGMLYLKKESEDSDSEVPEVFLLRAATATGTIWANARLKNVTSKDVANTVKMTILVPNSEGGMHTLLVKFPTQDTKTKVSEYLSKD